jgi:hypothetical protein
MPTTDVEEDLDVRSLSVVHITYHAWSFVRRPAGGGGGGVGSWLLKEVSERAKLLT